ncbi:MAG: hypothetical protein ACOX9E_06820, partial [Lentisphaeria bacterium]
APCGRLPWAILGRAFGAENQRQQKTANYQSVTGYRLPFFCNQKSLHNALSSDNLVVLLVLLGSGKRNKDVGSARDSKEVSPCSRK